MDCPNPKRSACAVVVAAAADLPDDALVQILSRLPIKPLCRSKCVAKAWRDLIAHPLHRRKLPQTLAGFFYGSGGGGRTSCWTRQGQEFVNFINMLWASGVPFVDPPFPFFEDLPGIETFLALRMSASWVPAMGSSSSNVNGFEADYATDFVGTEGWSYEVCIWVLEDYDTQQWKLKHTVSFLELFGKVNCRMGYKVIAIHPDHNLLFLVQHWNQKLISYDMDSREVRDLCTLAHGYGSITPYVPFFLESEAFENKE
ncbi:unnamed protein product [Urochloa decumbens]|uniref:F-box domain-containing protein n=1 Tax=Urochloa decumbens TaxID=240449 RepID=A0ABC9H8A9_9POAL